MSQEKQTTIPAPVKLLREAHACMRACGWHLAPASDDGSDGVLAAAVADIEERMARLLAEEPRCPRGCPDGECHTFGECEAP